MVLDIIIHIALLVIGFFLLVKGSDRFVNSSSTIAKKLGVSDFFIGLTLVAVGTSLPELASAITSSLRGANELIVGNLMGANIANIGLTIGLVALIGVISVKEDMIKRDGYIMMFISLLFFVFALNGIISPVEGLILILLYFAYILFLLKTREQLEEKLHFKEFLRYFFKFEYLMTIKTHAVKAFYKKEVKPKTPEEKAATKVFKESLTKDFLFAAISVAALIFGAKMLINEVIWFADMFNISQTFIGLSLLALGTTLPELTISINAIRKGFGELAIGNIIGSNIANIALIFSIAAIIRPVEVSIASISYLIPAMLLFSAALILFLRFDWKINKTEGMLLLTAYVVFILVMFYRG